MTSHHAVLVANAVIARLFDRHGLKEPWVETQDWWHGEGRLHARDLERAPLGHSLAGRTGLTPHTDIRERERAEFACDVAEGLKHAWVMNAWETLEIFASPPFLGELLAQLSPDVKKTVRRTHSLDLTALSAHELERRWQQEFKI